jgi:hypothetical protein
MVAVGGIDFRIQISAITENCPSGYLFLCPVKDLQAGPSSFRWADCTAYWSFDPAGVQYLSLAEARQLGFPTIQFTITVKGFSWDASVYAGLRKFHEGKGFDPDSQDVARHLGEPLFNCRLK